MQKIETKGVKILSWCPDLEDGAFEQMKVLAEMPYAFHAAIMADGHLGYNMPIGGVLATKGVVIPDAVGSDAGCGMCAVKLNLMAEELTEDKRLQIFKMVHEAIPTGFGRNTDESQKDLGKRYRVEIEEMVDELFGNKVLFDNELRLTGRLNPFLDIIGYKSSKTIGDFIDKTILPQLGTLGSGNHFWECQYDEEGFVWLMIHSGSRNIGAKLCSFYNDVAKKLNEEWYAPNGGVPFLSANSQEGKSYLAWLQFALKFAFLNRRVMMENSIRCFKEVFPNVEVVAHEGIGDYVDGKLINIHHNFASLENHYGRNVWVHRKGATKALKGMTGIIPGSMGTSSYIVKGLGNHRSFMSCSHGAGRRMGRMEYSRQMEDSYEAIEASLEGVTHGAFGEFKHGKMKGVRDVSEAPTAYKDVEWVMSNQQDLVEVLVKLRPLISVKG